MTLLKKETWYLMKSLRIFFYFVLTVLVLFLTCTCDAKVEAIDISGSRGAGSTGTSTASVTPATDDWAFWRGPDHDGIAKQPGFDPSLLDGIDNLNVNDHPSLLWKKKIGRGYSAVTIAGDYAYTAGFLRGRSASYGLDVFYCLDAETGEEIWTLSYSGFLALNYHPGPRTQPVVLEEKVYFMGHDGQFYCLDANSGAIFWYTDMKQFGYTEKSPDDFGYCASPVVDGDLIIINAHQSGIALKKETGEVAWKSEQSQFGYATPVVFDFQGTRYAAIFGYFKLSVIEVATGRVAASCPWETYSGCNIADPIIVDNRIFISSSYNEGCAMLEFTGTALNLLWKGTQMKHHMSAGVLIDGFYYGNDGWFNVNVGQYRCMDWKTGRILWTEDQGFGLVSAVNDYLILLSDSGRLSVAPASPRSLHEIAVAQLSHKIAGNWFTPPTVIRGRLYIRSKEGDLFCIKVVK